MKIIITGGAGFIGSAVARYVIEHTKDEILILDYLTYAASLDSLKTISTNKRYNFARVDICDRQKLDRLLANFQPDVIMHLAAESHVDRSIDKPAAFIQTNIVGTYALLEAARKYWYNATSATGKEFLFHHVSTDEVYGDLSGSDDLFNEATAYAPSSPYAASKAASDHLVRAWQRTYGLPAIVTNSSNNYGAYQFPEKLIPLTISNALEGKPIRVYGDGSQIRDWLYVEDHARALYQIIKKGVVGQTYNIGAKNERKNIEVVRLICSLLEELVDVKLTQHKSYEQLITFVIDRPGHDKRYAIDSSKIENELGWKPLETFESGLRKTIEWYISNQKWCKHIKCGAYNGERLGVKH